MWKSGTGCRDRDSNGIAKIFFLWLTKAEMEIKIGSELRRLGTPSGFIEPSIRKHNVRWQHSTGMEDLSFYPGRLFLLSIKTHQATSGTSAASYNVIETTEETSSKYCLMVRHFKVLRILFRWSWKLRAVYKPIA